MKIDRHPISPQFPHHPRSAIIKIYSANSLIYPRPYPSYSIYPPSPATPSPGMQMYCQPPNYVMYPNSSIYPSDRSSPPPARPITPHTPRSLNLLPQPGQVCGDNLFVPSTPLPSPPSSSSGTISSRESSPYSSPVDRFVGDDYSYPYVSFVESQQYVFLPLNLGRSMSN